MDFLTRFALPVLAIPPRRLYAVRVHGRGFQVPVEGADPLVGFHVTFYVAARSPDEASAGALRRARDRWETFYPEATGDLLAAVERVELLRHRFERRSRSGYSFYEKGEQE